MPARCALFALLGGAVLLAQTAPRFDERNRLVLKDILEKAAAGGAERSAMERMIGDHYAACMDEHAMEERGMAALKPELERIAAIKDRPAFAAGVARLHRNGSGCLFRFGSTGKMPALHQGGRDTAGRAHAQRVFAFLGEKPEDAAAKAEVVMGIETALVKAVLDRPAVYRMTRHELGSLAPEFAWDRYFDAAGAPAFDSLNIAGPPFFRALDELLNQTPLEKWKVYLAWRLARPHVAPEPLAGSERCLAAVDRDLGEPLGRVYLKRAFGREHGGLQKALKDDLARLHALTGERDYSALVIARDDPVGNAMRAAAFFWDRGESGAGLRYGWTGEEGREFERRAARFSRRQEERLAYMTLLATLSTAP